MIKAILFDLGEVLHSTNLKKLIKKISKLSPLPEKEVKNAILRGKVSIDFELGKISKKEFFKKLSKRLKINCRFKEFKKAWNYAGSERKYMNEFVKKLSKHYPIYLISNTNAFHFDYAKKNFKTFKHVKKCFLSFKLHTRKPSKKIFRIVLKSIKCKPKECFFTDDLKENVLGAKKLGINAVQFKSLAQLKKDLKKLGVKW